MRPHEGSDYFALPMEEDTLSLGEDGGTVYLNLEEVGRIKYGVLDSKGFVKKTARALPQLPGLDELVKTGRIFYSRKRKSFFRIARAADVYESKRVLKRIRLYRLCDVPVFTSRGGKLVELRGRLKIHTIKATKRNDYLLVFVSDDKKNVVVVGSSSSLFDVVSFAPGVTVVECEPGWYGLLLERSGDDGVEEDVDFGDVNVSE